MKISNETKIGILAVVSITILILGFNFLKGKNLFEKNDKIYAIFPKVTGLLGSNPVLVNGLQVGMVSNIHERSRNLSDGIVVTINLARDVDIPKNSVAVISSELLGTASLVIEPGDAAEFLQDGDTLRSRVKAGLLDDVSASLNPALKSLDGTLQSMDSLIQVAGTYFDPATKNNFQKIFANLGAASASLNTLIASQNSSLNKTLSHVNSITGNLDSNKSKINNTLSNLETTSSKLADLKLEETISNLNKTVAGLNGVLEKANQKDGTIGLLLNDKKLYNNLENTSRSLNILLDDLRVHPKRYVNVSVFGKKDKSTPLTAPLAQDSTVKVPNP
ncbi:MlaD family protein [Flavihumibacter fluvii]|uniref:MlaD family protein n=1 Tax=Flavihumibacter fluvii TaxID=2838157 RepID=UPI001BDE580F|nr:MlaD family protein [Flavihumibacter fluvii]ULQ54096.1 MlaD family protein [Flavihumibacter fluvii]